MSGARGIIVATLIVAALLFGLQAALRPEPAQRGVEFFPDMARSPASKSLVVNPLLAGGILNQPLPEGVIPLGTEPFEFGAGATEAARAGRELKNPFRAEDATAAARGEAVYRIFCATCHGQDGETAPPVVQRGMIPPPSLKGVRAVQIADGEIYHIITLGQANMASYAAQIDPADRWKAILAVRAIQKAVKK